MCELVGMYLRLFNSRLSRKPQHVPCAPLPQVAAGSVVLRDLPPHTTAAGVPAKILGVPTEKRPAEVVDQNLRHVIFHKNGSLHKNGSPVAASNSVVRPSPVKEGPHGLTRGGAGDAKKALRGARLLEARL